METVAIEWVALIIVAVLMIVSVGITYVTTRHQDALTDSVPKDIAESLLELAERLRNDLVSQSVEILRSRDFVAGTTLDDTLAKALAEFLENELGKADDAPSPEEPPTTEATK